jgi:pimeloyl-ACP methyl ester carboxylesterase
MCGIGGSIGGWRGEGGQGRAVRAAEVKSVSRLAAEALAGPAALVRDVHRAAAERVFGMLGVVAAPVRVIHDGVTSAVYASVRTGLRLLPLTSSTPLAQLAPPQAPALGDSPRGALVLGALNAAFGDRLADERDALALGLTIRRAGRDVVVDRDGLAAAFPDATPKLAVFVHGLGETDRAWRLGARRGARPYGSHLRNDLDYTPLYLRYNTGLHVSANGRRLSELLEQVVRDWPVDVDELVLVGHSMGGLVARSACHDGETGGGAWTARLRHVVCLGTPHLGAPLERAANVAGWALARLPETRPFGALVNARSAGIKDLRFGSCVEEDWCDCDPDEFLQDRCTEVPFLSTANYYFVGATLARDADSPFGRTVGDLLVQYSSASGAGRRRTIPFDTANGRHVGGINHFQLLNHPAVYEQLHGWLSR